MTTTNDSKPTVAVRTGVQAGARSLNHNEQHATVRVRTGVSAGGRNLNHNEQQAVVVVRTGVSAGGKRLNHNELCATVQVRTGVSAGSDSMWRGADEAATVLGHLMGDAAVRDQQAHAGRAVADSLRGVARRTVARLAEWDVWPPR